MTFGQQVDAEHAREMTRFFLQNGGRELDTAHVYNEGESERILGAVFSGLDRQDFRVATKVNPRISGVLDYDAVKTQLALSLERMKLDWADILYLHFPDPETPVENALKACAELYAEGKFRALGISNFPVDLLEKVCEICAGRGWVAPTVYQGVYNALSRKVEQALLNTLDGLSMRFYAYNPLAGGLLSGKHHSVADVPDTGRFASRPSYRDRYWKDSYFRAVALVREACGRESIPMAEAAYRWLLFHSALKGERGDGVILGASGLAQLRQNMRAAQGGPLPAGVCAAFEEAWGVCRPDAPDYYKYYTAANRR